MLVRCQRWERSNEKETYTRRRLTRDRRGRCGWRQLLLPQRCVAHIDKRNKSFMLIIVTLNPKFRAMQNRICDTDRAATAGISEARFLVLFIGLKRVKVRAARVGARLFAARNECLGEVEDDCDDKEYERHGVPSESGVFPCLRCHVSTLSVPKTSRNSENTDLDDIAFFGGASRQCRGRRPLA